MIRNNSLLKKPLECKTFARSKSQCKAMIEDKTADTINSSYSLLDNSPTILKIVWEDATTINESINYEQIKKLANAISVGYLIKETKEYYAICGFLFPDENANLDDPVANNVYRNVHLIPKKLVKAVLVLKTDWGESKKFSKDRFFENISEAEI